MNRLSASLTQNPARLVSVGFLSLIVLGTFLLLMPFSAPDGNSVSPLEAFFTATSAVTLTGLGVRDTGTGFTAAGQVVILALIQIGGFGIMSLTSLAGLILSGRLGLKTKLYTVAERRTLTVGSVKSTIIGAIVLTVICELLVAGVLAIRMFTGGYVDSLGSAAWMGIFHAVSAFNNAGFGLNAGSLIPYVGDAWIVLPIGLAIVFGGLGFPVLDELIARVRLRRQRRKPPRLSMTARITLDGTAVLLIGGFVMFWVLERNHAFAELSSWDAALAAVFQSITTRTAGFQSVDFGEMSPNTLMGTDILMFIGGGSGGTAGGLKITTFFVVLAAIVAEIKGDKDTVVGGRRVDHTVIRQALTVGAVAVGVITFVIACLRTFNPQFSADQIHFEVISAFATVGLSTGITADLSGASQILLCVLMFMGRVGPITLVAALATTTPSKHYSYPAERPYIG